jgi:pyruvate/2-oxoacid:ferredoxin oxidoreductase alpha subunit
MTRKGERIEFLVFREQDGRWHIVGQHTVESMAKEHLRDLERAGYQAGIIRVRNRRPL